MRHVVSALGWVVLVAVVRCLRAKRCKGRANPAEMLLFQWSSSRWCACRTAAASSLLQGCYTPRRLNIARKARYRRSQANPLWHEGNKAASSMFRKRIG